jgi:hypothetical protein
MMLRKLALICILTAALVPAAAGTASAHNYDWLFAPSTKCANQTNRSLTWAEQESVMRCMHNYARAADGSSAAARELAARPILGSQDDRPHQLRLQPHGVRTADVVLVRSRGLHVVPKLGHRGEHRLGNGLARNRAGGNECVASLGRPPPQHPRCRLPRRRVRHEEGLDIGVLGSIRLDRALRVPQRLLRNADGR